MSGDPLESNNPIELREEIIRLRDLVALGEVELGAHQGRIAELTGTLSQYEGLGKAYDELLVRHEHLASRWPLRVARRVRHPYRSRRS